MFDIILLIVGFVGACAIGYLVSSRLAGLKSRNSATGGSEQSATRVVEQAAGTTEAVRQSAEELNRISRQTAEAIGKIQSILHKYNSSSSDSSDNTTDKQSTIEQ